MPRDRDGRRGRRRAVPTRVETKTQQAGDYSSSAMKWTNAS